MASGAIPAFGSFLQVGDGATPENFTTIAEIINGPEFGIKSTMKDVTSHSSPGGFMEKKPTLQEVSDIPLSVNFNPVGATHGYQTGLLKRKKNQTLDNYRIVWSDVGTTTWTFAAYVSEFKVKGKFDEILTADIVLTPSGAPGLV